MTRKKELSAPSPQLAISGPSTQFLSIQPARRGGFSASVKGFFKRGTSPSPKRNQPSSSAATNDQSKSPQLPVHTVASDVSLLNIKNSSHASSNLATDFSSNFSTARSTPGALTVSPSVSTLTASTFNVSMGSESTASATSSILAVASTVSTFNVDFTSNDSVAFTQNINRMPKVSSIAIGQRYETTTQLIHFARLLCSTGQATPSSPASRSSSPHAITNPELSQADRLWINQVKDDSLEQARIHQLVVQVIHEFQLLPIKDSQSIREVVLVASVLDKSSYQALLRCLLKEVDDQGILREEVLAGIVQVVEDARPGILEADNLISILEKIRKRLENTAAQSTNLVLHLTQAVSRILSVMADMNVKDLDRVKSHGPVRTALAGLKLDDNPYLRFQTVYALQALRFVPDDETPVECFFRHFVKVTGSLAKVSHVMQMDFDGFANGLVDVQKSVKEIYDLAKDRLDDCISLKDDGKALIDEVLGSKIFNPWFVCLRAAEEYAKNGQMVELSKCINQAPVQNNQHFQWGVCQILGEVAADSSSDVDSRICSVEYLSWIHSTTVHTTVKGWILTLLIFISGLKIDNTLCSTGDETIKSKAASSVQKLTNDGTEPRILGNIWNKDLTQAFDFPCLLRWRLPLPSSFSLLQKANKIPDIEPRLHIVRTKQKTRSLELYVPLMCKMNLQASSTENLKFLGDTVRGFLESEREVLLMLGDSGAGKSTFNRHLEHKLWSEYKPGDSIPLFVDLKAMGRLDEVDIIQKRFELEGFEESEIKEIKRSRKVVLICDGYDECRQWTNLHKRLKSELRWCSIKIIVTCRIQYLASIDDRTSFKPRDENQTTLQLSDLYEETVIVSFKDDQIEACIEQFRSTSAAVKAFGGQEVWSTTFFLKQLTNLMDLVKNPFMLQIALRILPVMVKDGRDVSETQLTRFELYEEFTRQHFENERNRLNDGWSKLDIDESRAFKLLKTNFPLHCMGFSKRLANKVFTENGGVNAIEYSTSGDEQTWQDDFFSEEVDSKVRMLQQSSQLISYTIDGPSLSNSSESTRTMHQFPHRSILEFLYACQLFDHWGSTVFYRYFETTPYNTLSMCLADNACSDLLVKHPLNQHGIVSESSVLNFLVDRVRKDCTFQDQLLAVVHRSKLDPLVSQAAANAITILVQADFRFHSKDLCGIQIRGADLSGGRFDSVQLQGADLRDCMLHRAWLRQADLSNANMENVEFGELPSLDVGGLMADGKYSPNGDFFTVLCDDGTMQVYKASTWDKVQTLRSPDIPSIATCVLSPNGEQVAFCGSDGNARLWNTTTGNPGPILRGDSSVASSLTYSPDGQQIASHEGPRSTKLTLWNTGTGTASLSLSAKDGGFYKVAFSPDGKHIAAGSSWGVLRLWNTETGAPGFVLKGRWGQITCLMYSPDGHFIVAGYGDSTLRLWDVKTGTPGIVLRGFIDYSITLAYSNSGHRIAGGGKDKTVRLWDAQTGLELLLLKGHTDAVTSIAFSPNDQHLASSSRDGTIRVWDIGTKARDTIVKGYTDELRHVLYSPNGTQVASIGSNGKVQLWDPQTGLPGRMFITDHSRTFVSDESSMVFSPNGAQIITSLRHKGARLEDTFTGKVIQSLQGYDICFIAVAFSPDGQQISASGRDKTVRLWDAKTGALEFVLKGHTEIVASVAYSPNGLQIASAGLDCMVRLWDTKIGASGHVLQGHSDRVNTVAFSPNGRQVASGGDDQTVRLWDVETGVLCHVFGDHASSVKSVKFTPDGLHVASSIFSEKEAMIRLLDTNSGLCFTVIELTPKINCISWYMSANEMHFVVGSCDNTVYGYHLVEKNGCFKTRLLWTSAHGALELSNTIARNVQGLSNTNKRLLKQRGAVMEDEINLTETKETGQC